MRRSQSSAQAMFEFQKLVRGLNDYYPMQLTRTGRFWELWVKGDDFGMTKEEVDRLVEETDGSFVGSYRVGHVVITPKGAIKSLEFGRSNGRHHEYDEYSSMPVFAQLARFLREHGANDGYTLDTYLDVRPNGSMINVDVKTVENDGYEPDELNIVTRTIAEFTYDPANNLLLHRQ